MSDALRTPTDSAATSVSLSSDHVADARERVETMKEARAVGWLVDNREALESSNAWVEKHGLPLEKYRLF